MTSFSYFFLWSFDGIYVRVGKKSMFDAGCVLGNGNRSFRHFSWYCPGSSQFCWSKFLNRILNKVLSSKYHGDQGKKLVMIKQYVSLWWGPKELCFISNFCLILLTCIDEPVYKISFVGFKWGRI